MARQSDFIPKKNDKDGSESGSPDQCRERRHRRIQMRRSRPSTPLYWRKRKVRFESFSCTHHIFVRHGKKVRDLKVTEDSSTTNITQTTGDGSNEGFFGERVGGLFQNPMPLYGFISTRGLSQSMDDTFLIKDNFSRPNFMGFLPLHFFAVYDVHGGPHVSSLCRELMHRIIDEELKSVDVASGEESSSSSTGSTDDMAPRPKWENSLRLALGISFDRMDRVARTTCSCGLNLSNCGCNKSIMLSFTGSTAVVAILTAQHIVVANCGDSRAVLCRAGRAIPLSVDHKPERSDEIERIHEAGGRFIYQNGVRVYGILNMSRSLGDDFLKSVVISKPEITITERRKEDDCLIIASDGIWEVMPNELACRVANSCLRANNIYDEEGIGKFPSNKCSFAATTLCRLAFARESYDNISVIVVDLKKNLT